MLKQSSARVSSSLRGAQALRSRCGSFLRGLFSHMQQHNAGGTKKKKKRKGSFPSSTGPFSQEVEIFAMDVPASTKERCAGGHFFLNCSFLALFNWSGPDRGAASYEVRSCWKWDIIPSAHFHGLQSLNVSMLLLRQDDCSLRHVVLSGQLTIKVELRNQHQTDGT